MTPRKLALGILKKMKFLPQKFFVEVFHEYYSGDRLDLKNPVTFNEKIQWLKVYYHKPILTQLVDKYKVREYVKEKIGEEYLNDLLAVYDSTSEVDFDALPNSFVIKANHAFHYNLIVKDKSKLNLWKTKMRFRKWLQKNQYYRGGKEWAYKNVPPKLIAEKFLKEEGKDVLSDYKFFCFNGVPKFIQVDTERGTNDYRCYYDLEWKKLPFTTEKNTFFEGEIVQPKNLDDMITVSRKLAADFPFVRVDLYNISGKILFGEMTFYPSDARKKYIPAEYNEILGSYIQLPQIPPGKKRIDQ
tara:strand:+ start:226969 stop:227868 length:900 start_codon:yes stop_codon:yes gene_type:complete